MTESSMEHQQSQQILLATDRSARADRAEARAVERAATLGASLHVVIVLENSGDGRPLDPSDADPLAIQAEFRALYGSSLDINVTVEAGEAWPIIIREAAASTCGLIVLGPSQPANLKERLVGSTAERVFHSAAAPVLTVRHRVRGPYRRALAATDFSDTSRHALLAAADILPDVEFHLLHAYRVPYPGLLSRDANEPDVKGQAEADMASFLESLDGEPGLKGRIRPQLLYGTPDEVIGGYIREHQIDVVVMGAHGTGSAFDKFLGGTAERLLSQLPCDVMLSRLP